MTKKRFTTDNGSNEDVCLVDNVTGKEYESNFCDIVDLLNEQEETINILKHELLCKQLDKAMTEPVNCRCYVGDLNE